MKNIKLNKLVERICALGLDGVLIYDELNQRYLSEFSFTDGFLFISKSDAYLFTDFRYYEMAISSACKDFTVLDLKFSDERRTYLNRLFSERGYKRIGFEGTKVTYKAYLDLCQSYPGIEFCDIGDIIDSLRTVKSAEEIKFMQKAQDMTDGAFSQLLKTITPNMTEIDVAAELEYYMKKSGADGFAFDTIAVSGDASALPHGTPRNVKLKRGFLTMDFGAKYNGYCADMTRTISVGAASSEMKKLYNTVLNAQLSALDYLKEGVECAAADKVARDIIDAEYPGTFGHSLGHSVGLFIHEQPALSARAKQIYLTEGNVVTVEPGIYLFGKYGCRIEDMVLIQKNGVYNFTHSPKELIEI